VAAADLLRAAPDLRSERISPELVLVDPELAESARRLLPLPGRDSVRSPPALAAVPGVPVLPGRRPERISPELVLVDPDLADSARRLLPAPSLALAPSPPVVVAAPVPRGGVMGQRPAVVFSAAVAAGLALIAGLRQGALHQAPAPAFGPVAGGGYVAGSRLRFEVGIRTRAVTGMTMWLPCAGRVRLPSLPLGRDLSFAYKGRVRGSHGPATLALSGRFTTQTSATVAVRELGAGCAPATTRYVAALS